MAEQPIAPARVEFTDFVGGRGQALQRTAYLLTGDWALAEDLLQAALARVYPRWDRIVRDDPEAYVRKVIVNTWSSWWRRKWRGETPTDRMPDVALPDSFVESDRRDALRTAQVAAALGVSVGTVKSQTSKALAKLRADAALTGYGTVAGGE